MDSVSVKHKPFIFAVSGWKNTGKTTLITELIAILNEAGYKTAVIKHDGHDFEPDVPDTDSWKHRQAGAYGTAVFSARRMMVTKECREVSEKELIKLFPEADLILIEGLKKSQYPKVTLTAGKWMSAEGVAALARILIDHMRSGKKLGVVRAVCVSKQKGTPKENIEKSELITDFGLRDDAHAGNWHRQVSLLSFEKIEAFRAQGAQVEFGAFGENLVVEGLDFAAFAVGTKFQCGDVILELTQIGKECHNGCQIFQTMGDCIMPREGVFCRVLSGGTIQSGDLFVVL